jgi:hypothetical protein
VQTTDTVSDNLENDDSHPEGATTRAPALASSPQLVLGARGVWVWEARTTVRNGAPSTFAERAVLVWYTSYSKNLMPI